MEGMAAGLQLFSMEASSIAGARFGIGHEAGAEISGTRVLGGWQRYAVVEAVGLERNPAMAG